MIQERFRVSPRIAFGNVQLDRQRRSLELVKRRSGLPSPRTLTEVEDRVDHTVGLNPRLKGLMIAHSVMMGHRDGTGVPQ